ncbi:DNA translocase FtsK [Staphylococcus caeli]|uniref:DNA translocase FtsK n=1 Tax=Staphylococcus caeli TaxID=2201815 RepID=A0A1D4H4J5_9STAP|nr:DNA translocase FtsK [Staphylococcus caeli]SCS32125.1 DNA translocase FtsK [Staphylococcus caeli]SCS63459.1 DNA translocase FtsK [Staphylococcus caeli]
MSWFDKLFGEDNNSDEDYLSKRSQRRQKATQHEYRDSLLPQNNDVYERPKGKFRFPMRVLEEANAQDDNNQSASNEQQDYRRDEQSGSINTQYRRHRQMRDKVSNNDKNSQVNARQNTKTPHQSHIKSNTEFKQHKGKRMRIQTDVLRANATSNHTTTTPKHYHQSEFKASEVPSAIFGTHKPRPLENGVIKSKQDATNDHATTDRGQDIASEIATRSYNQNGQKAVNKNSVNSRKTNEHNDTTDATPPSMNTTEQVNNKENTTNKNVSNLNTSRQNKKDNTIKLENIYASQIVEEIRRERERKVLQKRQFKKALQQKRNENNDSQEDSIQKAIDEMYKKQAQNYIGESSLDDEDNLLEPKEVSTDNSQIDEDNATSEQQMSDDTAKGESSLFNYEEIDLDHVREKHTIDENQVEVSDESKNIKQNDFSTTNDMNSEVMDSDATTVKDDDYTQSESFVGDMHNRELTQASEGMTDDDSDSEIDDAQYRELSDQQTDLSKTNTPDTNGENKDYVQFDKENIDSSSLTKLESFEDTSNVDTNSELDNTSYISESEVDEANLNNVTASESNNEALLNKQISQSEQASSESDSTSQSEPLKQSSVDVSKTNKKSRNTIRKGSKPFNVVMTPSDKKRMLDAQKSKIQSFNHVNQPITDSNHSTTTLDTENQILSEHDELEITNAKQLNNTIHQDIKEETTQDAISQNSHEHQAQSPINEKSDPQKVNIAPSSTSKQSDNVQKQQNTQAPVLKPEMTGKQLGGNEALNDQQNNKAIRRGPNIKLPSVELLEAPKQHEVDNAWIDDKKQELNEAFYYFNVPAEVQNVTEGPSVTRFELSVEKGVKVSRITALQDDIKMALAAKDIRIEAPIPGTSLVGIEVPNQNATTVNLRSIIEEPSFKNAESKLTVAMGLRINNEPLLMDISKTPHALIAGATGSGKSVCINSILMSLLYKNHPEELRLLLIDPKMVELAPYNDLPHLVAPVITDVKAATQSLKWAVEEMERRYKVFAKYHVRNITAFNKKAAYEDRMPKIVIVIDELADLMMMAPQEVEQSIARIAQKARACGIHMLVATQRPSVNVITGLIKANIPTRIAFMVSSSVDSRTILDSGGAERLLGYGDMLYLGSGMNKPIRVQGTFVSDEEIDDVVDFIKQQREPEYLFEEKELLKKTEAQPQDDLFDDVCRFMLNEGHISTSLVQRHFQIGYNRAARIVDQLEQLGYISGANGSKPRDVYITESDLTEN